MGQKKGWRDGVTKPYTVQRTTFQRFWRMVVIGEEPQACWWWDGPSISTGYSGFNLKEDGKWKKVGAHRYSYEVFVGPIPAGLHIDHLCRNRWCVNPAHMEPVTCKVNVLRGDAPPARNAVAEKCIRGHDLIGYNAYRNGKTGKRTCRTCLRANNRIGRRIRNAGLPKPTREEMGKLIDKECGLGTELGGHSVHCDGAKPRQN